jgi:hypothetical protein
MKRIGENVFQFNSPSNLMGAFILAPFVLVVFIVLCIILAWWVPILLGIPLFIFSIPLCKQGLRYKNNGGIVLDKEKGVVILYELTFKGPFGFEEIQMNEIMGVDRDIDITTETKLVKSSVSDSGRWQTTERRSYNVVLQGKFGSRRFQLANQDDWNLFMTLLYGDTE